MRRNALGTAVATLAAGLLFTVIAPAQDFQRTYTVAPDGIIRIRSISGEVTVQGYDGPTVIVEGFRVGRNRDRVEVVDRSSDNRVDVDVRYQENCNCDASVNFQVRVPRSVSFNFDNIRSVSGSVRLSDVTGHVRAESTSGSVEVRNVSGEVSAQSVSGNVDVVLMRVIGAAKMRFSSISGSVSVKAPANLNAYVEMSTISGSLSTDFAIEILERRYGPGRSARGRVGEGESSIRITSVSGRVSLIRS